MDGLTSVCILEDDAILADDFAHGAKALFGQLPSDWHHLYLGGQLIRPRQHPPVEIAPGVVRCHNVNRCHAHALRGSYLKAAYQHLTDWPALARQHERRGDKGQEKPHHVDHHLGVLHESGNWNIYAPSKWLVGQSAGSSDICGKTLNRRFWQSGVNAAPGRRRRILVTGHPRSGTTYMAKLLQAHGLKVGHEHMRSDGISSWMMAIDTPEKAPFGDGSRLRDYEFDTIIHVVRDPLKVLASSIQTESKASLEYRKAFASVPEDYNVYEEAVHILLAWDEAIRKLSPTHTVRVEDADTSLPQLLDIKADGPLPRANVNSREHSELTWHELKQHLRHDLAERMESYSRQYGYALPTSPRPKEQALQQFYDHRPNYYTPATPERLPEILAVAGVESLKPGMRVLDLGCGNGRAASWFLKQGCQVTGVDYSAVRIASAKKRCPEASLYVQDVYDHVGSTREAYDLIVCFEVLEHLEEPERLLAQSRRCLAPGGHFLATVPIELPAKQHLSVYSTVSEAQLSLSADRASSIHVGGQQHAVLRWSKSPRFLIVGSAPYVTEWWDEHQKQYEGWTICAINNAWSVVHARTPWWYVSRDFPGLGTRIPSPKQRESMTVMTLRRRRRRPYRYTRRHGAMMVLDVVFDVLNRCVEAGGGEIHVVGSDLVYPPEGDSHFYGKGRIWARPARQLARHHPELADVAADPLRRGDQYVIDHLARARRLAERHGVMIKNAGDFSKSRLPFDRTNEGSGITAIVPSINYADMLEVTLPALMTACEGVVVVTEPGDPSIGIAEQCGARVVESRRRENGGLAFDKGALLNDGLAAVAAPGWVLLTDADTVVSPHLASMRTSGLDRNTIYGTHFRVCPSVASWHEHADQLRWSCLPEAWQHREHRRKPGGCFQLFWFKPGHQHPECDDGLTDYKHVDQFAGWRFLDDPNLVTIHLGPLGKNHRHGRFRSPADRRSPLFSPQEEPK